MQNTHATRILAMSVLAFFAVAATAQAQLPVWLGFYVSDGQVWETQMVGEHPLLGRTTHIPVIFVPLKLKFALGGRVFDPMQSQPGHADSPVAFALKSPMFQPASFPGHPETHTQPTQYLDAYQRASFWNIVTAGSTSPTAPVKTDFHVLLNLQSVDPRTLTVPFLEGFVDFNADGKARGHVNKQFIKDQLDSLLETSPTGALTIFFMNDVNFFDNNSTAGGWHNVRDGKTYIVSSFNFDGNDVAVLGHELAEWLADPFGNNPAPGCTRPDGSCQHNLEVGDPNSGNNYKVANTFTLQDASYVAWFARTQPSMAFNACRNFQCNNVPNVPCK